MSLRAEIEAVLYAAEEPVTLTQLAAVFAQDLPALDENPLSATEEHPSVESLIERGFVEASNFASPDADLAEVALLTGLEERKAQEIASDPAAAEAEAKRAARQRERDLQKRLKQIVDGLIEEYSGSDRGMEIREVAGGYRIATKPEYHDAVRAFVKSLKPPMKLSLQALETLAVIAYKQPVTAPEVSEIRGVDSSGVLGGLISRKLITTAGRKQVIGRPILYKTTREFLLRFGLKDINELPSIEEFEKLAGDLEFAEDSTASQEETLPFEQQMAEETEMSRDQQILDAVEANAGEPGIAVVSEPMSEAMEHEVENPAVVALNAVAVEETDIEQVETAPAAIPTVPIEDHHG